MTDKSAPITLSQVAPELRESIKKIPRTPVSSTFGRWLIRTATKLLLREKSHPGVRLEKHITQDGIPLRIYIPDTRTSNAALLWIHGGGLVVGSAIQDSAFCAETAHTLGITVISTEYRLAPEFPFPAALDDCYAAWNWLQESATHFNIDQHRVGVGGQSAGGDQQPPPARPRDRISKSSTIICEGC